MKKLLTLTSIVTLLTLVLTSSNQSMIFQKDKHTSNIVTSSKLEYDFATNKKEISALITETDLGYLDLPLHYEFDVIEKEIQVIISLLNPNSKRKDYLVVYNYEQTPRQLHQEITNTIFNQEMSTVGIIDEYGQIRYGAKTYSLTLLGQGDYQGYVKITFTNDWRFKIKNFAVKRTDIVAEFLESVTNLYVLVENDNDRLTSESIIESINYERYKRLYMDGKIDSLIAWKAFKLLGNAFRFEFVAGQHALITDITRYTAKINGINDYKGSKKFNIFKIIEPI